MTKQNKNKNNKKHTKTMSKTKRSKRTDEVLHLGYEKILLIRSLKKFIFRYQDLVEIYSVSAEKISLTFTSLSLALL